MLSSYFDAGGPVMYAVLGAWVVVLAGVLDRASYALGRAVRRPGRIALALAAEGDVSAAWRRFDAERARASRGLERIDAVSQLATSIGLFGTVLGLARTFLARGGELALAAPDVLAAGLSTALYTTVAGLVVFLFGQTFLIAFREWDGGWAAAVEAGLRRGEAA